MPNHRKAGEELHLELCDPTGSYVNSEIGELSPEFTLIHGFIFLVFLPSVWGENQYPIIL